MSLLVATKLSALDVVRLRVGGTTRDALREALEYGKELDRLGFHRLWLAEHHNLPRRSQLRYSNPDWPNRGRHPAVESGSWWDHAAEPCAIGGGGEFRHAGNAVPWPIDLGLGSAPGADGDTMRALRRSADPVRLCSPYCFFH